MSSVARFLTIFFIVFVVYSVLVLLAAIAYGLLLTHVLIHLF